MIGTDAIPQGRRRALENVARDLHVRYEGVFGKETIEALVEDSYLQIASTNTVATWLVIGAERLAGERLDALVHAESQEERKVPAVLFLCTHNAGRSQMALGWFTHFAGPRAMAWSGGSEPASDINHVAVEAMAEVGIDISTGYAKPWTDEVLTAADVVVTMGCGDACPLVPGKHYEDWEVSDPAGQPLEAVRPIRDELGRRVRSLLAKLEIPVV
ncbi:MAG: arsenate reductase ArsC [Acidimicrobiales bacterium]